MAERRIPGAQSRARAVARKLAMQALYQWQMNRAPWQDLCTQFGTDEDMERADREYFQELVRAVVQEAEEFDRELAVDLDRPPAGLDPLEHAILLIGAYELARRPDVPFRVVITEGVGLAKRFGATDGHKYVNAVLDRLARRLRTAETGGAAAG
ncbi:MAG TPA: transcription antitermination factor NusB [Steroidobacteraceae bacterium]|nr:transcription antitermination factor NusB [Steroidobacteraceae bacterium]